LCRQIARKRKSCSSGFLWAPPAAAAAATPVTSDDVQLEIAPNAAWTATNYWHLDFNAQLDKATAAFHEIISIWDRSGAERRSKHGRVSRNCEQGRRGKRIREFAMYIRFPRSLRVTPAITTFNPAAANAQVRDESASVDTTATGTFNLSPDGVQIAATGNASTVVGATLAAHMTADAGI
jgi:hypothetical protein